MACYQLRSQNLKLRGGQTRSAFVAFVADAFGASASSSAAVVEAAADVEVAVEQLGEPQRMLG